jgi:hypothetical protein
MLQKREGRKMLTLWHMGIGDLIQLFAYDQYIFPSLDDFRGLLGMVGFQGFLLFM